ncbi:DMT family transporter [Pseudoalteromonas sp. MMG012]|uniref:DMT family transporter n=1 Tax=Pseudoalteromonas sp. MMG012 TaxID=2822686 RepID=UPI001B39DF39|nr:DMT family transporter [Pseudoalteromonas sp. MMG012]MBQ4851436.1 DMT family transporter [Pseudoalteromonas sp. MMG012]
MPVQASYMFVIFIWSTTPLGIVWSSESMPPTLSVFIRMSIALVLAAFVVSLSNIRVPWHKRACTLYTYSALGIFGGMLMSYMAAQTVTSGVISLIFGMAPIISGLLAQRLLGEARFTAIKFVSLGLSLIGLYLICAAQIQTLNLPPKGLLYVFCAVCSFSLSGVMIKRVKLAIHPMATTFGALVFVTPLFALFWYLIDGEFNPEIWSERSMWATVYLGIFGSLLGFLAYFHVLQKLSASTVALSTLITPAFAVGLGAWLNNETITVTLIVGAVTVLLSLALFIFGDQWLVGKAKCAD